jgi:hypothetical protein
MKNLNRTIKMAAMPKLSPFTSVNRTFLYSLCAAFLLLTGLLSMKAIDGDNNGDGQGNAYTIPDMTLGVNEYYWESNYNSYSPLTNTYGDPIHSGSDKWLKVTIYSYCYLQISTGSQDNNDFDPVLHLLDENADELSTNDDSGLGPYAASAQIGYYVSPGVYYIILDGTDKNGHEKNGGTGLGITIN